MTITRLATSSIEILLHVNGIAEFSALPEKTDIISIEDIKELEILVLKSMKSHRLFLVVIVNGKYSAEARKHIASQKHIADKIAMVAVKPIQVMVGNFFLGINKPDIPIKLFRSKENAEKWLLG